MHFTDKLLQFQKLQFQKLLTQIRDHQIVRLAREFSHLGEECICELVKELKKNKSVKEVYLNYCGLGPSFANTLSDVIKVNHFITTLDLLDNDFGDQGTQSITEALKVNQCVTKLNLGNNRLGPDGARAIAEMLKFNKTLEWLSVSRNSIGLQGTLTIAKALKVNQCVKVLHCSYIEMGAEGAQAIGEALEVNCSLKKLFLWRNNLGAEGKRALLNALQVNGSLIECRVDEFQDEVNVVCKRNVAIHKRAAESVVHLLALRRMRRIVSIPREMMLMIAQMLWNTKCDVDAWNYEINDFFLLKKKTTKKKCALI